MASRPDNLTTDYRASVFGAGRVRKKGEMNGKSNNMNNVLQQIYPTGCYIPPDELIGVFDADQVRYFCLKAMLQHSSVFTALGYEAKGHSRPTHELARPGHLIPIIQR